MAPQTPYSQDLGDREPLGAMHEAAERMRTLAAAWSPAEFERSYAPGKWSARQIFIHLAQTELAFGNRARMAIATPNYTAQPFDQDKWMAKESGSLKLMPAPLLYVTNVFTDARWLNRLSTVALSCTRRFPPILNSCWT